MMDLYNIVTEEELLCTLLVFFTPAAVNSVIRPRLVEMAALKCFLDRRDDLHSDRLRLCLQSLETRGVFPWIEGIKPL